MLTVHRDRPAIILVTIGTTMRGAVDDIPAIRHIVNELGIGEHYIHADAALSGMILPYVDDPQPFGFDAGINSISISGHKLIGAPLPCGVVVTRKHLVETLGRAVELVGVNDTTLSGSRNGLTPLMLWYAINHHGEDEWRETVRGMLDTAEYAVQRFNEHGISAWRHRNSPTVVFDRPSQEVFDRWQIAPEGDVAHIITMPHVDFATIDRLVGDCSSPRPEPPQEHDLPPAETGLPAQEQQTEPAHATTMQRIVIMAENRIGVIAEITSTLAAGGVNLNSIATENEGQHGVVITADRTDHALAILNGAGAAAGPGSRNHDAAHRDHGRKPHRCNCRDYQHPGGWRSEPQRIATENEGQHGVVIITTDRTDHALAILNEAGFKAVSDEARVPAALPEYVEPRTGAAAGPGRSPGQPRRRTQGRRPQHQDFPHHRAPGRLRHRGHHHVGMTRKGPRPPWPAATP